MKPVTILAGVLFFTGAAAHAQRLPADYERLLVPVLSIAGWRADLWVRNDGVETVDLFPLVSDANSPSRGEELPLQPPGVPPGVTLEFSSFGFRFPQPYSIPLRRRDSGAILDVEKGKHQDLRFQLRVGKPEFPILIPDTSLQIAVVHESMFTSAPISRMHIHVKEGTGYMLRVYSLDDDGADITVGFDSVDGVDATPEKLQLERRPAEVTCRPPPCPWPEVPFTPAYAAFFFDTGRLVPGLNRIEVRASEGAKIWTFLSATAVVTSDTRIFTPN